MSTPDTLPYPFVALCFHMLGHRNRHQCDCVRVRPKGHDGAHQCSATFVADGGATEMRKP